MPSCCSRPANPSLKCLPRLPPAVLSACVMTVTAILNINNTVVTPIRTSSVLSIVPPSIQRDARTSSPAGSNPTVTIPAQVSGDYCHGAALNRCARRSTAIRSSSQPASIFRPSGGEIDQRLTNRNLVFWWHLSRYEVIQTERMSIHEGQNAEHRFRRLCDRTRINRTGSLHQHHRRKRAERIVSIHATELAIECIGQIGSKIREAVDGRRGSSGDRIQHPIHVLQRRRGTADDLCLSEQQRLQERVPHPGSSHILESCRLLRGKERRIAIVSRLAESGLCSQERWNQGGRCMRVECDGSSQVDVRKIPEHIRIGVESLDLAIREVD